MDERERQAFIAYSKLPAHRKKVEQALGVIREALSIAPACVAISWGKDSTVLLHLCQQVQPDILAVSFGHPERELISNYSEVEKTYCERFSPNLQTILMDGDHVPAKVNKAKLWELYPMAMVGLRKEESAKRSMALVKLGLIHQFTSGERAGSWRACPIGWWTWKDVWAHINSHELPYLEIYDRLSLDRGRTTDHLSKTASKTWQQRRLAEFQTSAPEYYRYLQQNYPEMFI